MWSVNAVLGHGRGPRLFTAITAGLSALAAAALFLMLFDGGLAPPPARAEAEALMPAGAPAPPLSPRLCFHGSGSEILSFGGLFCEGA
jgi:hypothetical protein